MKYSVDYSSKFKKQYLKMIKQGKDISKLDKIITKLVNGEELEPIYKNHRLINDKTYKDCWDCHIEPNWILIYKIDNNQLVLVLFQTGSHQDLFNK